MSLTSTTAPGSTFASRSELADHYKSDWHKYNLKRREAGLTLLEEKEFKARLEAALALRKEKEKKNGTDHIKNINKKDYSKKKQNKKTNHNKVNNNNAVISSSDDTKMEEEEKPSEEDNDNNIINNDETTETTTRSSRLPAALVESQENPEIDPKQSLFDQHQSDTLEKNVEYMQKEFGFFLPDQDCLVDLEGLLGYAHEKIKLGHYCLYCEKTFPTWQGCQQHMINKEHCKVRYEEGFWDELDPFYDFRKDNKEFVGDDEEGSEMDVDNNDAIKEEDDGWEDMSDGDNDDDDESKEIYEGYEREIARFGLDVTALGELVFPDGRVVGHRALHRYYKQRLRSSTSNKPSVQAAQAAAGERLYDGRVISINEHKLKQGEAASGSGKGILVSGGGAAFSTLSLYRFRAAIRKQRKGDEKGRRLKYRQSLNMNRMDKKANRLMNGVSVAHAKR